MMYWLLLCSAGYLWLARNTLLGLRICVAVKHVFRIKYPSLFYLDTLFRYSFTPLSGDVYRHDRRHSAICAKACLPLGGIRRSRSLGTYSNRLTCNLHYYS